MENSNKILDIKNKVLADAMSAIDIVDVIDRIPSEDNAMLYIKTSDIKTIDSDKLFEICAKYSNNEVLVTYIIPTDKVVGNETVPNTDLVNIFIDGRTVSDHVFHL